MEESSYHCQMETYLSESTNFEMYFRMPGGGPIDDDTLEKWIEPADFDQAGFLSFADFARASVP